MACVSKSEHRYRVQGRAGPKREHRSLYLCSGPSMTHIPCICAQGQETRKVTDLAEAMRDAGLDPDEVTGPIEEEYAAMELP